MAAVCLACGAAKMGALAACRSCGHHPRELEDQARHLWVDESLDPGDRLQVIDDVRGGRPVAFDEEAVSALAREIEAAGPVPLGFALLVAGLPVLVLLALFVSVVWLLG